MRNNGRDHPKSAPSLSQKKNNSPKHKKKFYQNRNYSPKETEYYPHDQARGYSTYEGGLYYPNGNPNLYVPQQPQYSMDSVNYMMNNLSLHNSEPQNNQPYFVPDYNYYPPVEDSTYSPDYYNYNQQSVNAGYNQYNNYNYNHYGGYNNHSQHGGNYYYSKTKKNSNLEKRIQDDQRKNRSLLKKLDERRQIVGQVHPAVIRDCNHQGIILDLILYDKSGFELLPEETEDRVTYKELFKDDQYYDKDFPRYIVKSVIMDWKNLPPSINSLPIDFQISSTLNYLPPFSTFKVYCIAMEPSTSRLYVRMAKSTTPVIRLPAIIDTKLSYSNISSLLPLVNQANRPRFLIIIDFEATCDFSPNPVITPDTSEIIEFPWVVLDTSTLNIVYERQLYVKPSFMGGITNYCRRLTGITEKECENGLSLQEAITQFNNFLRDEIFKFGPENFRIVTDSVWDLQVQLRKESIRKSIHLEWWYKNYFDLRQEFRQFYAWFPFIKRGPPLIAMLHAFGLDFVGRHHSGLDDCKSIAQIVRIMLQLHPNTFTNPKKIPDNYDPEKDSSWCSFMGKCPDGAWLCSNDNCLVYNKPHLTVCNFCHTIRNFSISEPIQITPVTSGPISVSTVPIIKPDVNSSDSLSELSESEEASIVNNNNLDLPVDSTIVVVTNETPSEAATEISA